jgi:MAD (mothers against decapentaplegic) interacting protein
VTGASFIVFNGALKAASGLTAKSSIVEDGLMVQISQDKMVELRKALERLEDFQIDCGPINADSPDEIISIVWTDATSDANEG